MAKAQAMNRLYSLRGAIALSLGVVCATVFGAPSAPLATVKNNRPNTAAAIGGQPPALVSGKPRFPIVPAGVPIKATPITRITTSKGVQQGTTVANNQAGTNLQTANQQTTNGQTVVTPQTGSGPVIAGKLVPKNSVPGKSVPSNNASMPVSSPSATVPVSTPGNAPATSAPSSSGNGGNSVGGSAAAPATSAPSGN
jgi:hypothetical protein